MAIIDIHEIETGLEQCVLAANAIKDKIQEVAENKDIPIVEGTDTPLTVLTKIDNATVKTPAGTINITQNGTTDVTNYANANVNVQPNLQAKSETITQNGTQTISADTGYDGLSSVTLTINVSGGGGTTDIEIALPSAFANAYDINYFQVDSNRILLGGRGVTGVWLHNISTNSTTRLYSSGQRWASNVQQVGNNFLVGANYTGTYGLLLYKPSDNTITNLVSVNKYFWYFTPLSNTLCACSNGADVGIYIYDDTTQTATQVITGSQQITASAKVGDKYILANGSSSIGSNGIYLYNDNTKTCSQLVSTGRGYTNMQTFGDYILISSISSSYTGISVFDSTNDTLSTAYSTGYNWVFQIAGTKCISASNSTSGSGLLVFDTSSKQMTQIYSSGYKWFNGFTDISATTHLLSGQNGVLKFDSSTNTATIILANYASGNIFKHVSGNKIVIAGNSANIILYDITNSSASVLYTGGNQTTFYTVLENGNDLLISGTYGTSTQSGLILYNSSNSTTTRLYIGGGQYDTVEAVSSNTYYISSSAEEVMYKLLYNSSDKTAQLYSVRIGG